MKSLEQAQAATDAKDYARAIELYSSVLDDKGLRESQRANILSYRAYALGEAGLDEQAEADLTAALKIEPKNASRYSRRGVFYFFRDRFDQAEADFDEAARLERGDSEYLYWKGRIAFARSQFKVALVLLTQAIQKTPGVGMYHLWRAESHMQLKMYPEALEDYDRALATRALLPDAEAQLFFGRGYLYLVTDKFEAAARDLEKGLALVPDDQKGLRRRGVAYDKLNNRERAIQDYERVLALNPNDSWVAERLSKLRKN